MIKRDGDFEYFKNASSSLLIGTYREQSQTSKGHQLTGFHSKHILIHDID